MACGTSSDDTAFFLRGPPWPSSFLRVKKFRGLTPTRQSKGETPGSHTTTVPNAPNLSHEGLLGRFGRELECTVADDLIIFNDVAH